MFPLLGHSNPPPPSRLLASQEDITAYQIEYVSNDSVVSNGKSGSSGRIFYDLRCEFVFATGAAFFVPAPSQHLRMSSAHNACAGPEPRVLQQWRIKIDDAFWGHHVAKSWWLLARSMAMRTLSHSPYTLRAVPFTVYLTRAHNVGNARLFMLEGAQKGFRGIHM